MLDIGDTESQIMIVDIPSENDFCEQAFVFLNLAWDTVFDLLLEYQEADEWEALVDKEQTDQYWAAAQRPLATAVALSQQGAEFLLKSKIARISPYLLLSGNPNNWPKKCDKVNTNFSSFHTADAQDLIKIQDTVADVRLSENFLNLFNKLRLKRNTIFHTVDKKLIFTERDIILGILDIVNELVGKHKWVEIREEYLNKTPSSAVWSSDYVIGRIAREMLITIEILGNNQLIKNFNFSKKKRRYFCPKCQSECRSLNNDLEAEFAQLQPNSLKSTILYCFVCRKNIEVHRKKCKEPECPGNVIHAELDYECLTCLESQEL